MQTRTKLNWIFRSASNKYFARVQQRNVFGSCPGQHSLAAPINDLLCSWHQEHQAASTPKEEESTKLQAALVLCPTTQLCHCLTVKNTTALANFTIVLMPSKAPSSSAQPHSSQEHNCFGQLHNCTTVPMPSKESAA